MQFCVSQTIYTSINIDDITLTPAKKPCLKSLDVAKSSAFLYLMFSSLLTTLRKSKYYWNNSSSKVKSSLVYNSFNSFFSNIIFILVPCWIFSNIIVWRIYYTKYYHNNTNISSKLLIFKQKTTVILQYKKANLL